MPFFKGAAKVGLFPDSSKGFTIFHFLHFIYALLIFANKKMESYLCHPNKNNLMEPIHIRLLADTLQLPAKKIESTIALLNDGATVPFIARYRKEATGSLDEGRNCRNPKRSP